MEIPSTVTDVIARCTTEGFVPVNADMATSIEAHRQRPCPNTLYVVILARTPGEDDMQQQLDYLTGLPDEAWRDVPHWEEHR